MKSLKELLISLILRIKKIKFFLKEPEELLLEMYGGKPILAAIFLLILFSLVIIGSSLIRGKYGETSFQDNILIEAHGLLFDIFVFGILIVAYNRISLKIQNIRRWKEEIDDFRHWKEEEAKYRIIGNVRRLNRNGISKIDLSFCYLENSIFNDMNLSGARFFGANLRKAKFDNCCLTNANLECANLQEAVFHNNVNLQGATLDNANLNKANLSSVDLRGAFLEGANLKKVFLGSVNMQGARLRDADLEGAIFGRLDRDSQIKLRIIQNLMEPFKGASFANTNLKGVKNLYVDDLYVVETLYKIRGLDPVIEDELKEKFPHLFIKPKWYY